MSERALLAVSLAGCVALAGCGQKGPLYLPERASEVVTRPAPTGPAQETQGPNTPQTIDSPEGPANPAPEVTGPEDDEAKKKQQDDTPQP